VDNCAIITVAGSISEVQDHFGTLLTARHQAHNNITRLFGVQAQIIAIVNIMRAKPKSAENIGAAQAARDNEPSDDDGGA
jgi:hypothetical protein